ncbi:glycosyltransferase [Prochlorococcus sp. MIT 1307]|uniref:glycosyltransferase n=1 Tax=Prochlorococcus sp. MIT 1307 TaxID=3096219 RepID=UPI002A75915E|nr:glycosyltransferase [Prochlorococcus sp. MIT 1307]
MNKNISQIFLTDLSIDLPIFLSDASNSIKNKFKDYEHKVYNNEELRFFIKSNFDSEVLWAYDVLKPYSYKSDLGRFCLLYQQGGWYFDIAIKCLSNFQVCSNVDMICFRDEQRHSSTSWAVAGGIIWSKSGNNILSTAIKMIIQNCRERWYGRTPLCPTGPSLFGEAIAKENRDKNIIFGYLDRPNIPFTKKNIPFLRKLFKSKFRLANHKTFALVKPASGGDLKALGVHGSNNYNQFWKSKTVYNDIPFTLNYK